MASEAGKGSKQRPTDMESYRNNYDLIFSKKKKEDCKEIQQPVEKKE
jgi:hypothetical protein